MACFDQFPYEEKFEPHRYAYNIPCPVCKNKTTVEIPGDALFRYRRGAYIQNAMPMLDDAQREILMTGICGSCWINMFSDDPSE